MARKKAQQPSVQKMKIKGKIAVHKDTSGTKIFVMPSHDFTYKANDKVYAVFRDNANIESPVLRKMEKMGDEHYYELKVTEDIDITALTHAAVARVDVGLVTDDKCVKIIGYEIPALS